MNTQSAGGVGGSSKSSSNPLVNTSNSLLQNRNQAAQSIKNNDTATKITQTGISVAGYITPVAKVLGPVGTVAGITDTWTNNAASKAVNSAVVKSFTPVAATHAAMGAPGVDIAKGVSKAVTSTYNGIVNTANTAYNQIKTLVNPATYVKR